MIDRVVVRCMLIEDPLSDVFLFKQAKGSTVRVVNTSSCDVVIGVIRWVPLAITLR